MKNKGIFALLGIFFLTSCPMNWDIGEIKKEYNHVVEFDKAYRSLETALVSAKESINVLKDCFGVDGVLTAPKDAYKPGTADSAAKTCTKLDEGTRLFEGTNPDIFTDKIVFGKYKSDATLLSATNVIVPPGIFYFMIVTGGEKVESGTELFTNTVTITGVKDSAEVSKTQTAQKEANATDQTVAKITTPATAAGYRSAGTKGEFVNVVLKGDYTAATTLDASLASHGHLMVYRTTARVRDRLQLASKSLNAAMGLKIALKVNDLGIEESYEFKNVEGFKAKVEKYLEMVKGAELTQTALNQVVDSFDKWGLPQNLSKSHIKNVAKGATDAVADQVMLFSGETEKYWVDANTTKLAATPATLVGKKTIPVLSLGIDSTAGTVTAGGTIEFVPGDGTWATFKTFAVGSHYLRVTKQIKKLLDAASKGVAVVPDTAAATAPAAVPAG